MARLVVGGIAVVAFLITGQIMGRHEPPVAAMEWAERLRFRSRHIYLLCAGLVNLAIVAEPMAGRWPGMISSLGLFALFGGVPLYTLVSLRRTRGNAA